MTCSTIQTSATTEARSRQSFVSMSIAFLAIVLTAAVALPGLFSPAGASEGCGTYSFGFAGTRLLNDGISDVSGPYPIDLPSGTYVVTLVAHDHHDTQIDVPTQPGEQYVVELDSGYVSPPSLDIPDDQNGTTTVYTEQKIAASSSITVRHGGVPGINSVDVVCVGFTPQEDVQPVVEEPQLEPPTVSQPIETPVQDIGDPVSIVREPAIIPPATVIPEVKGLVEAPPVTPQLAITGPSAFAQYLVGLGAIMIIAGIAMVNRSNRSSVRP